MPALTPWRFVVTASPWDFRGGPSRPIARRIFFDRRHKVKLTLREMRAVQTAERSSARETSNGAVRSDVGRGEFAP